MHRQRILLIYFVSLSCYVSYMSCSNFERFDSYFENYEGVVLSQTWRGGWLPNNLPHDAFDIYESHYIDENNTIVSFNVNGDFKGVLDSTCTKSILSDLKFSLVNADWWPNPLYGNATFSSHEFYYYNCDSDYFAIPFNDNTKIYFWRIGK